MFVISITYTADLEVIDSFLSDHVAFLDHHYEVGNFILSGRKVPRKGGVIISIVKDRELLENILSEDPFVREGLASYDVTEIVPTKSCSELAFLVQ